ncbi:MAG: hypothetical protein A3F72_19430 [Bacteroidetes bacterium RIFCSPLOWO2_12_FULL_35_15]|nr:MAG: hypothetical protein A3F72_19430 [Bacteroidetes bacterium RIFCSPLOWO2_12_FULL_35_15]
MPLQQFVHLMNIIDSSHPSKEDLMKIYAHIKHSASQLDAFTRKLTLFMHDLTEKHKNQNDV